MRYHGNYLKKQKGGTDITIAQFEDSQGFFIILSRSLYQDIWTGRWINERFGLDKASKKIPVRLKSEKRFKFQSYIDWILLLYDLNYWIVYSHLSNKIACQRTLSLILTFLVTFTHIRIFWNRWHSVLYILLNFCV